MAYATGSCANLADVRNAIVSVCTANGWTWDAGNQVLSKGTLFLNLTYDANNVILKARTALLTGDTPYPVKLGVVVNVASAPTYGAEPNLTFPLTYHIFVYVDEVYCILNFNTVFYQWCMFGKSTVTGLDAGGTGMYVAASGGNTMFNGGIGSNGPVMLWSAGGPNNWWGEFVPAPFWCGSMDNGGAFQGQTNYYVHSNLDGHGWHTTHNGTTASGTSPGISHLTALLDATPSAYNTEMVLLPNRCYKGRASSKISLVADLEYSRLCRIDNVDPGQIITLGADQWMVFPFVRKSGAAGRNAGNMVRDSGTFGWAIRYNG